MIHFAENIRLLQRYEIIYRESMRLSALLAMRAESFDLKCVFGKHIWQDAQSARWIQDRLREMNAGILDSDNATGLDRLVQFIGAELPDIQDTVQGQYGVLKTALLEALNWQIENTAVSYDHRTSEILTKSIHFLEEQITFTEKRITLMPNCKAAQTIREALDGLASITGYHQGESGENGRFDRSKHYTWERPHKQLLEGFQLQRGRETAPKRKDREAWRIFVFRNFLNEIGAGDNVASLMLDAPRNLDRIFYFDIARHAWDEYRHALIGYESLERIGLDPHQFSLGTGVFEFRDRLPFIDRYAMLVFIDETQGFVYKKESEAILADLGDQDGANYLLYDISDETRHVTTGRKWIPILLKALNDPRSLTELKTDQENQLNTRIEFLGTGDKN